MDPTKALFRHESNFETFYTNGEGLPKEVDEGWNWMSVTRGLRRWGYDVVLKSDEGHQLDLFVEAKDDSKSVFVTTTWLSIAHGTLGEGLNAPTAGAIVRRFGEILQGKESRATEEEVQELLESFPATEQDPAQTPVTAPGESGGAPVDYTQDWSASGSRPPAPTGNEEAPVHFSSKSAATNCDFALFRKLYLADVLPHKVDDEISVTSGWVNEDHPCIVTRLSFPDGMHLDVGLEPIGSIQAKTKSGKLHVMHRDLEFPLDPERVISIMERYAEFLEGPESNISDEDIASVFSRKWLKSDGSVGAVMETVNPRSALPDDDTPSEFAATNCDTVLYKKLYFGDDLPVAVIPGVEITEVWVNEHQPCIVHRLNFDEEKYIDVAIEPLSQTAAKVKTGLLHVMHGPLEIQIEPDLIIKLMTQFAEFLEGFEENVTSADVTSIFTRKRIKDLG